MSDSANGPGWWQASDSKWYPPEQHPDYRPPPPQPPNLPPPPPPPPLSAPSPLPLVSGAVATPDPPKEKRPFFKEPLFLALVGSLAFLTLAAVVLGLVSDGDSTSQSGSSPSREEVGRWTANNPGFSGELSAAADIYDDLQLGLAVAVETGSTRVLEEGCQDLATWVRQVRGKYDYPNPEWDRLVNDLGMAASSCLDGDLGDMAGHIDSANVRLDNLSLS